MIDYVSGKIQSIRDLSMTIIVQGIGLAVNCPHKSQYQIEQSVSLYCYMHWNTDSGPSLYGFSSEFERQVFLLVIEVPKIGPKIALTLLSSLSAKQILEAINAQNEKTLSSISGIGPKKAEQIVTQLRSKVAKLISSGAIKATIENSFAHWQHLTEALTSLGYTKPEISQTIKLLTSSTAGKELSFDKLLRSALAHLSKGA